MYIIIRFTNSIHSLVLKIIYYLTYLINYIKLKIINNLYTFLLMHILNKFLVYLYNL